MVGRRRTTAEEVHQNAPPSPGEADLNEIVAYNFRAARELRGLTQEETAELLERFIGQRLPQASISAIERAYEGDRRREFDARASSRSPSLLTCRCCGFSFHHRETPAGCTAHPST